jgi:hypothetical protein
VIEDRMEQTGRSRPLVWVLPVLRRLTGRFPTERSQGRERGGLEDRSDLAWVSRTEETRGLNMTDEHWFVNPCNQVSGLPGVHRWQTYSFPRQSPRAPQAFHRLIPNNAPLWEIVPSDMPAAGRYVGDLAEPG